MSFPQFKQEFHIVNEAAWNRKENCFQRWIPQFKIDFFFYLLLIYLWLDSDTLAEFIMNGHLGAVTMILWLTDSNEGVKRLAMVNVWQVSNMYTCQDLSQPNLVKRK